LTVRTSSRRSFEQRLAIRYPGVFALVLRLVLLMPTRWRLRRATLRHVVQHGIEAYNRGDYDALRPSYHRDVELISEPEVVALGFDPVYRGHAGWLRYAERWNAEWGTYHASPEELIDLGDARVLAIGHQEGRGVGSGAATVNDFAVLWTWSAGQVIREQYFFDRAEAFRVAGLDSSGGQ
jgi:ketosteroid isomerase-like protein